MKGPEDPQEGKKACDKLLIVSPYPTILRGKPLKEGILDALVGSEFACGRSLIGMWQACDTVSISNGCKDSIQGGKCRKRKFG